MAVTTIHPIRSTVELSVKYICNPDKTDSQILISSHGCGHKTADLGVCTINHVFLFEGQRHFIF